MLKDSIKKNWKLFFEYFYLVIYLSAMTEDPYMKLLLLIVPALISAILIVLSPIVEEKKFRNNLYGKSITVFIDIANDDIERDEVYTTVGVIGKIKDGILEISRKTQPKFRVPYNPEEIVIGSDLGHSTDYIVNCTIDSKERLDLNRGILEDYS